MPGLRLIDAPRCAYERQSVEAEPAIVAAL